MPVKSDSNLIHVLKLGCRVWYRQTSSILWISSVPAISYQCQVDLLELVICLINSVIRYKLVKIMSKFQLCKIISDIIQAKTKSSLINMLKLYTYLMYLIYYLISSKFTFMLPKISC